MNRATILVVEDDPSSMELAVALLEWEGYTVYQASHGTGLIELVKVHRPDLILLDLQLPGMDGLALARLLKQDPATQGIILVAMTAYALPGDREQALAAGCDGYIPKPLDTHIFRETLRRFLSPGAAG